MNGKWERPTNSTANAATQPGTSVGVSRPVVVPATLASPGAVANASDDAARWWPRWSRLLEEQQAAFARLDALSRAQHAHVLAGDADAALEILGERQGIVERLRVIGEDMAPLADRRAELAARLTPADRTRLDELLANIERLAESVRERDTQDRAELERQRLLVARELTGMARGRGAVAAYTGRPAPASGAGTGGSAPVAPRFQDREG